MGGPRDYVNVRISPDGRRVAAMIGGSSSFDAHIWVGELERGTLTRLTTEGTNRDPVWTPDGRRVTFIGSAGTRLSTAGIKQIAADGSGKPEMLLRGGLRETISSWTPDGTVLLFSRVPGRGPQDGNGRSSSQPIPFIWLLPVDGSEKAGEPRPFLESAFAETNAQVSPVGGWVAYESSESGKSEVYVRPFPGPGGKTPVFDPRRREPPMVAERPRVVL
jgi:Tol biopolymer transport system component